MKITVNRRYKKGGYTIGAMHIDGKFFSDTLEDRDRGLDDGMGEAEIAARKVYGQTAIPTGTYRLEMTHSPKFATRAWGRRYGGKVPQLMGVKGFSGVRIHPLNTAADSLGCIGVGRNLERGKVLQSTQYYYKLLDGHIQPALGRGEVITITIM